MQTGSKGAQCALLLCLHNKILKLPGKEQVISSKPPDDVPGS